MAAGLALIAVLSLQTRAFGNEDELQYALILDDEGVVINVAVVHPVDSAGWLEAMEERGAHVIVREQNTVGIGSVLQPDGSFARKDAPPPAPAPEPPADLPGAADGTTTWSQHGAPPPSEPAPREPVFADRDLAAFLGVPSARPKGSSKDEGFIRSALIIEHGVVVNVAVYHAVESVGWLELMRNSGATVVIVPEHGAGIGWVVREDGSIVPPAPRPGLVWNGSEWRAPGTEQVVRPGDVRGWSTGVTERIREGDASVSGLLIVPDEALSGGPSRQEVAERSIVMLESYGDTVPLLARFDGLTQLRERRDDVVDEAIMAQEQATGEPVSERVAESFRSAVQRLAAKFLGLFGLDVTDVSTADPEGDLEADDLP